MDDGGNHSLTDDQDETDIIDSLLNTQSQHDLNRTHDGVTDSQFDDNDMYYLIKSSFGQLDRKSFKAYLLESTDTPDLRPIRKSLFDLIKKQDTNLIDTRLIERTQKDNSLPVGERLADDIFILFQYLEGSGNITELKQCFSRSSKRKTTTADDPNESQIYEIVQKLTKKANCKTSENGVMIAMILELKQMLCDNIKPLHDKIDKLTDSFKRELKSLKTELKAREIEVQNLNGQLSESRGKVTKLQSELKLKTHQLKVDEDLKESQEQQSKTNENIAKQLESIDRQIKKHNEKPKKMYSEVATQGKLEEQNQIPVIINSTTLSPVDYQDNQRIQSFDNVEKASVEHVVATDDKNYTYNEFDRQNENEAWQEKEYPLAEGENTSSFRGTERKRTKRIVLYNVIADKPFSDISSAVRSFAQREGVRVTFTKLLKKNDSRRGKATYVMRVNINEDDYYKVIDANEYFWPKGIYWRDYVPYYNKQTSESQWGS